MAKWVIPDVHGCAKTLQYLIEQDIKATKSDNLYFLGDYIDRGPDAKGVIDYIMSLQKGGYNINYILGNHEAYLLDAWENGQKFHLFKTQAEKEWDKHGGLDTLRSFGVHRPKNIEKQYIDWIKKGQYFIELDNYVLVHAGMNFSIPNPFDDVISMIWKRDFKVDRAKIYGKKLIHGHVPVEISLIKLFIQSDNYDFVALDNGVYYENKAGFGNLLAFNPDTKELIVQPNIDF